MSGTISGSVTVAYTLSVNPTTILDTGTVAVSAPDAIYGNAATAWSVLNAGVVQAATSGVAFGGDGYVDNQAGGTISGGHGAVLMHTGTVTNAGLLSGTTASIIQFDMNGGLISNAASGRIVGGAVGINMQAGTVLNAGGITGATSEAVSMRGGTLSNAASGTISAGNTAVAFLGSGTVVNAGLLQATAQYGYALQFFHGYTDRLVVDPGAVFAGQVGGAGIPGSIVGAALELASGAAIGTLTGLGSQFTNFGAISEDADAEWQVSGSAANGLALGAGAGVTLVGGSSTLAATASGPVAAVYATAGGTVTNYGHIDGQQQAGVELAGGMAVNVAHATITGFTYGVVLDALSGTITNAGVIRGLSTNGLLMDGGVASNAAGGVIEGGYFGIIGSESTVIVTNAGAIGETGSPGNGIALYSGGTVTNLAGGTIAGQAMGVYIVNAPGTIPVLGIVLGTNAGAVPESDIVDNAAGALISGSAAGVAISDGAATVINAGSIAATAAGGDAVRLSADVDNLLVVDPGAAFTGTLDGGNTIGGGFESALELAVGDGGFGTLDGPAFVDFGLITLDTGARWLLGGDKAELAAGQTIAGFVPGDTIELQSFTSTGSLYSGGQLMLSGAGGGATLDLPGSFMTMQFSVVPDGDGNTDITVACFAAGARLLTMTGEVPVEALAPGDLVATVSGRLRPVRWIGHRRIEPARHPSPLTELPVRIEKAAFGPGAPHRALWLSPDHAVYWDGVLIPVRHLCNGKTIRQEPVAEIVYYHVELDVHDVVLAEGLPVESYLDTGNRSVFANDGGAVEAHPDYTGNAHP